MGVYGGPNIADEGLVFFYDTGNGKSYKGEPTVNLASNADFSNGTTGWNANQNVTLSVETINGTRFLKGKSNQTNSTPGFKSSNIAVSGNTTYTLTIRAYKNDNQSIFLYATGNGTGGADIVWSTAAYNGPNPITNTLTTISRTFTTPADMTYLQIGALWSNPLTTSEVYVEYMQLEAKPHATQFVNGTRSATQGLLDLAGNASIDLTNGTFNSSAELDFDGTSGIISIPYSSNLDTPNGATYECVIYPEGGGEFLGRGKSDSGTDPDNPRFYRDSNGYIYFDWSESGTDIYAATVAGVTPTNAWSHVVGVAEPNQAIRIYVNGVESSYGIQRNTLPSTLPNSEDPIKIGGVTWIPRYFNGKVAMVKLYNRVLTDQEILDNFNGIKSRFGI